MAENQPSSPARDTSAAQAPERGGRWLEAIRALAPISRAEISRPRPASRSRPSRWPFSRCSTQGSSGRAADAPGGPSYGAVFFEPVPGRGVRARPSTSAHGSCEELSATLAGQVRARQDCRVCAAPTPTGRCGRSAACTKSLIASAHLPVRAHRWLSFSAFRGVIDATKGTFAADDAEHPRARRPGLRRRAPRAVGHRRDTRERREPRGCGRALGRCRAKGSTTSRFSPSVPAWAWDWC